MVARRYSTHLRRFCRQGRHLDRQARRRGVQPPVLRLDHGVWPRWSPDGKFLSFSSNLIRGSIWMMPADSGPPRLVADSTGPYGVFSDQPLWSPDGRSILTRSTNQEGMPRSGRSP